MVVKFSKSQMESFAEQAVAQWDTDTAAQLQNLYPRHMGALGVAQEDLEAFCRAVRGYATHYRVTASRDVFKMVVIAVSLGAHFPHDPRFEKGIHDTIARAAMPQERRLALFGAFAARWLGAAWDGRGVGVIGLQLAEIVQQQRGADITIDGIRYALNNLVLQSPTIATQSRRQEFFDACLSHADSYNLFDPQERLAYVGGALIHGIYWFDDPLMRELRGVFDRHSSRGDFCAELTAFYKRFG